MASRGWPRLILLWLAGCDLRVTLLAVPPLLPLIHAELNLDEKGVAILSGLPLLLLGIAAVPGSLLIARVGARNALLIGLVLIGTSGALRGVGPSVLMLFSMTVLMGAGISISQPTMPSLVRNWFHYPGLITRATGFWSNGLLVGELFGAALTLPLLARVGSWEAALAVWSVPVFITVVLLAVSTPADRPSGKAPRPPGMPDWRNSRMWRMGFFQSAASMVYFGANTFIPDYLHATNQAELVGLALASLNGMQVPASFVIGLVPIRILVHRSVTYLLAGAILLGLIVVLTLPGLPLVLAAGVFGFCAAYVLVLSFALPALIAARDEVARLSAGVFGISYTTAFLVTLISGAIWDASHIEASAFLPALAGAAIILGIGPGLVKVAAESD